MIITAVEKNKKNKERYSIFVDGKFSFSIREEDYFALGLYENKEISDVQIEYIKKSVNLKSAKSAALRFLSYKIRTEKEVYNKILEMGFDASCAADAVEELKSFGYINNRIYVQKFLYDRSKLKPKSKKLLKFDLLSKGVSENIIDEIMSEWDADDTVVAANLFKQRFGKYNTNDEKIRIKAIMFLRHRGFSGEVIKSIVGESFED